jgi:hypothetical protein
MAVEIDLRMSSILKLAFWLSGAIIVVAVVVITYFIWTGWGVSVPKYDSTPPVAQLIVGAMRRGDFSGGIAASQAVKNNPLATLEEKAIATHTSTGAQYFKSGDVDDLVSDIAALKQVVLDTKITLPTRVNALNTLARTDSIASGDKTIPSTVFEGDPFNQYFVPGQPTLSYRKLYEWSYSLAPTPDAAIHIAKWYADQHLSHPELSASTRQEYIVLAEDYLRKGEAAVRTKARLAGPAYLESDSYYIGYQFWKACVIGRLAAQGVAPYTTEFRSGFDQYISFAERSQNRHAKAVLPYARFNYAQTLSTIDPAAAKVQLDLLAKQLSARPATTDMFGFTRLVKNTYAHPHDEQPSGSIWANIVALTALSADFKNAIDTVIATVPAPND